MGLTEDGVVNLLADTIEHGYVIVVVLGTAVTLDGFVPQGTLLVELLEKVGLYHVVGIEDDHIVVVILNMFHGILHGLGF